MSTHPSSIYLSTVGKLLAWAESRSLWVVQASGGCCADEVFNALGSRYDLERFGVVPQQDPRQADLLIVSGAISAKAAPELKKLYDAMLAPRYVIAVGTCASGGGPFQAAGAQEVVPVDVFIPGCPPRPEAVMNGIITLQEKILGKGRAARKTE